MDFSSEVGVLSLNRKCGGLLLLVTIAALRPRVSPGLLLASQTNTPRFTPPASPPSVSASVSPTRTSKPVSPKRHSVSFSTTRGLYDDRSSVFSSVPSGYGSMSGSDPASQTG